MNKKKDFQLSLDSILIGSGSSITTSTLSLLNPSVGLISTSSTALLTSIAFLITNESQK